jgi:hypothetical protein
VTEAAPDEPQAESEQAEADTAEEFDTPAEPFAGADVDDAAGVVAEQVRARNVFINSTVTYERMTDDDGRREAIVETADITAATKAAAATFLSPPGFDALGETLSRQRIVLLVGAGCGKQTAAAMALARAGCDPLLQIASNVTAKHLVQAVVSSFRRHKKAGILIDSVESSTLAALGGFGLKRLRGATPDGGALVLTARAQEVPQALDVTTVQAQPPDASRVVQHVTRTLGASPEVVNVALAALALLPEPVPPRTASGLAHAAVARPTATAEELAADHASVATDDLLDEWLNAGPTAEQVAALAAAATLDGSPTAVVDAAAATLASALDEGDEETDGPKIFRPVDRGWPAGAVELAQRTVTTHFGRQVAEVVALCPPHTRQRTVAFLWRRLGADFRSPFIAWLHDLAAHERTLVRRGAAMTAGVLLVEEPLVGEGELLRPWALDDDALRRASAAMALGLPAALGADPTAPRRIAQAMSKGQIRARHTAVMAYGGLLGAWDPGSVASTHLWRIGDETPQLRAAADSSLASLVCAGGDAARVRAAVLGVLAAEAAERPVPPRVYRLLPRLLRRLTASGGPARASLAALTGGHEDDNLHMLGTLLAQAFDDPAGRECALDALRVLLIAVDQGRLAEETLHRIVQAMKGAVDGEQRARVGQQLREALQLELREHGDTADAARALLATLFPTQQRSLP